MNGQTTGGTPNRAERIAEARRKLAEYAAANPGMVANFNAKMMRIAAAAKRERARVDHLVLGVPRPMTAATRSKRQGRRKVVAKPQPVAIDPGIDAALDQRAAWSHKQGTPETHSNAGLHHDAIVQLERNGTLDKEQVEWVAQIANVHRSIEADVAITVASLEARVDNGGRGGNLVGERIHRVRMHLAYGYWRALLPAPKSLVLDMIVGDAVGYTVAAQRYRVHNRKAKRLLLEAIARWPACVAAAFSAVDQDAVDAMNRAEAPVGYTPHPFQPAPVEVATSYERARREETGRERTDEPFLLPPVDSAFLDERGYLLPWAKIAEVVRKKVFGDYEVAAE